MQVLAKNNDGECISDTYINCKTKLQWMCKFKHYWMATPNDIGQGKWCPFCVGKHKSIHDMKELAKLKDGSCLSEEYQGCEIKLEWKCKFGHIWETTPNTIISGRWCPECAIKNKSLTIEEMQEIAKNNNGYCISTEYKNSYTPLLWKCKYNHVWSARPGSVKSGTWCPDCNISFVEMHCKNIFEEIFKTKFVRKRHAWLKNNVTGLPLELDGYCSELNIAFEYQGKQHYKECGFFNVGANILNKMQARDALKVKICKENNIKLIVIDWINNPTKIKIFNKIVEVLLISNIKVENVNDTLQ